MRVPKYYLVKQRIAAMIDGLEPGARLASERSLATRLDTSRTTVRQAVAELIVEGRLERAHGSGCYVAEPKLMQIRPLTSFSQDLSTQGWRPGSVVLDVTELPAAGEAQRHLLLTQGAPVLRVERLRTSGDTPIAHETAHLPGPLPGLAEALAREGSLYSTLAEVYGVAITTVEDVVETFLADPMTADLLTVDPGLPMLLVHRTGYAKDGRPVEWTRSVFRGDRFRFVSRQELPPTGPATPGP